MNLSLMIAPWCTQPNQVSHFYQMKLTVMMKKLTRTKNEVEIMIVMRATMTMRGAQIKTRNIGHNHRK